MNRKWTNRIRFLMDECIPPVIRDSKWFMYPFYMYAYRGRNIKQAMNFKKLFFQWSEDELRKFYAGLNTISTNRNTDISAGGIKYILGHCKEVSSVLDVGCGKGYLLDVIAENFPSVKLQGADFVPQSQITHPFTQADARKLPFPDKSFDLVVCTHTIEHVYPPVQLVHELKRVAKQKIIVITPRQRHFFYTLDEHINFFPRQELLTTLISMNNYDCRSIDGDWVYTGWIDC